MYLFGELARHILVLHFFWLALYHIPVTKHLYHQFDHKLEEYGENGEIIVNKE